MIRKLKIYISNKERELRTCDPRARDRLRGELKALKVALQMKKEIGSPRQRTRVGTYRSGNSENASA